MTLDISSTYIPHYNEIPDEIATIYQPKDMANPTREEVAKFIESVQKSNAWFAENIARNIEENDIVIGDLNRLSDDLKAKYDRYNRQNKVTYKVGHGIELVVNSVAAMFVAVKTQAVVAAVFFKPAAERVRDSITVTSVFVWVSGILTGILICEMSKKIRLFG